MDTASPAGLAGAPITPTDPGLPRSEHPRLSRQCMAILGLLAARPQWNYELALVGLSYTRRLSDLRAAGLKVDLIRTGEHGARLYGLVVPCPACETVPPGRLQFGCPSCGPHGYGCRVVAPAPVDGCRLKPIALSAVESLSWGVAK